MNIWRSRQEMELLLSMYSDGIDERRWSVGDDALWMYVNRWFMFVKMAEQDDTFKKAWDDNRLTVRAILDTRKTGTYVQPTLPARKYPRGVPSNVKMHDVNVLQGIAGLKERMDPMNWLGGQPGRTAKYTKGLHDNSACLMNNDMPLLLGASEDDNSTQMYRTSGDTLYVWMPLAPEEDMVIFGGLCDLAKSGGTTSHGFKSYVDFMRRRFTRVKFTFEGDAGCGFRDFSEENSPFPRIKYGYGNFLKVNETPKQVRARKVKAREYTTLIKDFKGRNEIVVAYRQHGWPGGGGSKFPMYAKGVFTARGGEGKHLGFVVVDDGEQPTGDIINLKGQVSAGNAGNFGGYMTTPADVASVNRRKEEEARKQAEALKSL